ncbi:MAG: hypothetical protein WA821_10540 [Anaerolineales bacterium]
MANDNQHGKASHIGQIIGEAFENVVIKFIKSYLKKNHAEYVILDPGQGKKLLTLNMPGGIKRQLDTVVAARNSDDPIALLETKWLKDGRHWNDKGAWILQLREVRRNYPTVRGAAAILAGFWNEGFRVLLRNQGGGIDMILVATDEEIYKSLQPHLDKALGNKSFELNAKQIRGRFPEGHVEVFDDFLIQYRDSGELYKLAKTWLNFGRAIESNDETVDGKILIQKALDALLKPLPESPKVSNFEITLEIETGNLIHKSFKDLEELLDFINTHAQDPAKIRELISPKKRKRRIGEQTGVYDADTNDDDDW